MAGPISPPVGTRFSTGQDLALLAGPTSAPVGAVVVIPGSSDLGSLTSSSPAGTTFYLLAGRHVLGGSSPGAFSQVVAKAGNTYLGAPGAVLDGRNVSQYAFAADVPNVTIRYLEIVNFACPFDEFAVNHDAGANWLIEYCHIHHNGGAGVGIGINSTLRNCWLHHNQQYGFSSFKYPVNDALTPSITDVTVDRCEISHNGDMRDEYGADGTPTYNGRNGSCKFWDTDGIVFTNSWLHHSYGTAIWADTNNIDTFVDGNLFEDNAGIAFFYEISYNFKVSNNTFRRNALNNGLNNNITGDSFPMAAIYISESGGDSRGAARFSTSEISHNTFVNNWDDIALWENADRFCNSPANTSGKVYKPLGGGANLAICNNPAPKTMTVTLTAGSPVFTITAGAPLETTDEGRFASATGVPNGTRVKYSTNATGFTGGYVSASQGVLMANATTSGSVTMTLGGGSIQAQPAYYDCRWHTQNILISNNTFDRNTAEIFGTRNTPSASPGVTHGRHAVISQYGTYPAWSPYQGTTIQNAIVTQNNVWANNTYRGSFVFMPKATDNQISFTAWRAAPYSQDAGSTLSTTAPTGGGGGTVYVPDAPTAVVATAGNASARVAFAPPVDDGGDTLIGYTVTASPGGAVAHGITGPITVPGLTNGTPYTFTVRARSTIGISVASAPSSAVTPTAGATLPAVVRPWQPVKASAVAGTNSATVSFFTPASTGGATITGYTVTASPGGATATGPASPLTLTGLADGIYTFTVTATNSAGAGAPSQRSPRIVVGTPTEFVPDAPVIGAATAATGAATVSFTPGASDGGSTVLGYEVTASPGGHVEAGTASPITVTGLANGTTYTFVVRAINAVGPSSPSSSSNAVTPGDGVTIRSLVGGAPTPIQGLFSLVDDEATAVLGRTVSTS